MKSGHDRRAFMRRMGLGSLALSLPSLQLGRARAQGTIPKRIVFFYGSGMLYRDWEPVNPAGGAPSETAWEPGLLHASLAPFQKDLIYLDGIGMVSEEIDSGPIGNAHEQGAKHALAAANTTSNNLPGGPSIDQFIAQRLNAPAPVTRYPSIELQVSNWSNEVGVYSNAVASAANQPLPSLWNPSQAYQRIFGDFIPPNSDMAAELRAQQAKMFGLARDDFGRLMSKVGKVDRERLDAHLSLLNDLEKRLGVVSVGCTKPDAPVLESCDFRCYNESASQDARNWHLAAQHHTDLIAASLACDLTRVAFLDVGYGADETYGYQVGDFDTTDMHDLIHRVNDDNNDLARNQAARAVVQRQCSNEAEVFADLLTKLSNVTEADGQRLLDHTVVVYCGQIAYGDHHLGRLPWVLAGSCGGYFKTGRYLKYPKNPRSGRGQPHNNLFVSLANAMGIDVETFGNPACCTGPLDFLRG